MFQSARLKLTAWYLLSIMLISILFSLAVYQGATGEIRRGLRMQAMRSAQEYYGPHGGFPRIGPPGSGSVDIPGSQPEFDSQLFADARRRVALQLLTFNTGIFILAGLAGYFLAGRTLRPIEQMVDEQKRFVADASHELRTPLTAMRTEVEVALRDKNLDAGYAREVLESNIEEIGKLQLLSDHLLMMGRYQSLGKAPSFAEVSIAAAFAEARQNVQVLADYKNIAIGSDVEDVTLQADRDSLIKLLIILLDNAIKYSYENGKIEVGAHPVKDKIVITVHDFGAGIRAGDIPYIFNRFYRADTSRSKTKVEGYGLGLAIAKGIVDMHNGRIDVDSTPETGTTFTITLPRQR